MPIFDQPEVFTSARIAYNSRFLAKRTAIICDGIALNWAEFHQRTNQVANALIAARLSPGERVCLVMDNSLDMFCMIWGIDKAGGVVVPLCPVATPQQLELMMRNCDPRFVFADAGRIDALGDRTELRSSGERGFYAFGGLASDWENASAFIDGGSKADVFAPRAMSDTSIIIYSSGTTGMPKGIELSHLARLIYPLAYGPPLGIDPSSVILCGTPLYANGAWIPMLPAVYWGGCTVIMRKFDAGEFFALADRHGATHTFLVPTQCAMLIEAQREQRQSGKTVKALLVGAGRLDRKPYESLLHAFSGARVFVCYGMTEGIITLMTPTDFLGGKFGSVGLPIYGSDIRIIDENGNELPAGEIGEIVGYGAGLMKGYFRNDALSEQLVWRDASGRTYIRTGDSGRLDEDGYLYLSDRLKDMIKSGGVNVYASDLETIFAEHPEVAEVAVVAAPHEKWGETPVLFAIKKPGSKVDENTLLRWGNERLSRLQRVSKVVFRTSFPRSGYDKVLKRALRAELEREFHRTGEE